MRTFKDAEARLAAELPGYESRTQQQDLAVAIEGAIASGTHLLGQAGCGTGKSFGYLITAILSGKRTIVSTATKSLQDQIANGDLPFLAKHLGVPFTFAILKGRSNYLCLNKAQDAGADLPNLGAILAAAAVESFNGEIDDLGLDLSIRDKMLIASDSDDCQAYDCKSIGGCFADAARKAAKEAQIVVVNHALYLTDLKVKIATGGVASMLDEHDVVVFDEAHEIEEYASSALGSEFKEAGVRALVSEARNFAHRDLGDEAESIINGAGAGVTAAVINLWGVLSPGRIREATLLEAGEEFIALANALNDLAAALASSELLASVPTVDLAAAKKRRDRLQRRAQGAADRFAEIVMTPFTELVRWVEEGTNKRGEKLLALKSAPVHVGAYLDAHLWSSDTTAILVSATLSVAGKGFGYIAGRLGIEDFTSIDVGTPFSYSEQAILYVPKHLPEPTPAKRAQWSSMMATEIAALVKASDGRALLLFTSNREMRAAHDAIADRLPYTVLKQGDAPTKVLAEAFKNDTHSVLFATRSFFTGVDFQGDTCSLVVMDKLPFPVPTEPLTEARCDAIKEAGGNDFGEYTIPVMSLVLQQGFGRLIRHRNDIGCVAILDPRLLTKGYGKAILKSLPDAPVATKLDEVQAFYDRVPAGV